MKERHQILEEMRTGSRSGLRAAFAYDRISDDVQADGVSLDAQALGATVYAKRNDLSIVRFFTVVESASKGDRKVFKQMIDLALEMGIEHLIFKNTDRMSRNYEEWIRLDKAMYSHDLNLHFYQNNRVINRNANFNDRFLIHIELAVASQLSDKISQDVREANRHLLSKGIALRSAWGYERDTESKALIMDKKEEPILRYFFDEFDSGKYSLRSFMQHLREKGIKPPNGREWRSSNQVWQILTNPIYHGEYCSRKHNTLHPCKHEPYYAKSRYDERMKRLKLKYVGMKKDDSGFAFESFLRCSSCGRIMSGDDKQIKRKGGKKGIVIYYVHKCPKIQNEQGRDRQISIREETIVQLIDERVKEERFSSSFAQNLKTIFNKFNEQNNQNHSAEKGQFETQIEALEKKKSRLLDALLEGFIDDRAALNAKLNQLNSEIESLEKQKKILNIGNDKLISRIAEAIDYLRDTPREYLDAPIRKKAGILSQLAENVRIDQCGAQIVWRKPFSIFMTKNLEPFRSEIEKVREPDIMLPRLGSNQGPSD